MKQFTNLTAGLAMLLAMLTGGCSPKAQRARLLDQANRHFDAGQYEQAEIEYTKILQADPENAKAIGRLGIIYCDEGRFGLAIRYLQAAKAAATNDVDVRLKLGMVMLVAQYWTNATTEANFVLDQRPDDEEAPLLLVEAAQTPNEVAAARRRLESLTSVTGSKRASIMVALGTLDLKVRPTNQQEVNAAINAAGDKFRQAESLNSKSSAVYAALGSLYLIQNQVEPADQALKMAAELSPPRSPRRLKYAMFRAQLKDLAGARKLLEEIVQATPDYLAAWQELAALAADERKFDDASKYLKNVLAKEPQNFEALFLIARMDLAKGDYDTAVTNLTSLSKFYAKTSPIYYQLAGAYLKQGETGKAFTALTKALSINADYPEAILLLTEIEIRQGDYNTAIVALKQMLKAHPKNPNGYQLLADAYRRKGDLDEAYAAYVTLNELLPKNKEALLLTGLVLSQQGKKDAARAEFRKALEAEPDYLEAVTQLVDLDVGQKKYADALKLIEQQIARNPKSPEPLVLQSKVFMAQTDTNQAEAVLLKAVELKSDFRPAYIGLAQIYEASNRREKAMERLRGVLANNPNDVVALMLMGTLHNQNKEYVAAQETYEKLLSVNPNFSPALNNLAYLYSEQLGQLDKAYDMARRARALLPYDPATADTLGWILSKRGQYHYALGFLQESAAKMQDEAEVLFHLGKTYYMLGDERLAALILQRTAQSKREFPGKDEARRCLAVLAMDPRGGDESRSSLEKKVAEQPGDPELALRLAGLYEREGGNDKALEVLTAASKADHENVRLLVKEAELYSDRLHDVAKGLEFAKAANKLAPDDPQAGHVLGHLIYLSGDRGWALSLLEDAARKLQTDPGLLYDLGEAAYSQGRIVEAQEAMRGVLQVGAGLFRTDEAKRFLELSVLAADPARAATAGPLIGQILKTNADYVPALMVLGLINERTNNFGGARQIYDKALNQFPEFAPAKRRLAIMAVGEPANPAADKKAYDYGMQAREVFPDDTELSKAVGILAYRRNDWAGAERLLKERVNARPDEVELNFYLGMAELKQKKNGEGKATLQRALTLQPNAPMADDARKALAGLK